MITTMTAVFYTKGVGTRNVRPGAGAGLWTGGGAVDGRGGQGQ